MAADMDPKEIRRAIKERYAEAAQRVEGLFGYPTGREGARGLKYRKAFMESAPPAMIDHFFGVGNPFRLGEIKLGESVLDVGCGVGFDVFCASRFVGPEGRVVGIDLIPEMVERARANLAKAGASNAAVHMADAEQLPFPDEEFDVVISNGVLNLSPEKVKAFTEIFRVLKPGGRLQFADIVLTRKLPPEERSAKAWSN